MTAAPFRDGSTVNATFTSMAAGRAIEIAPMPAVPSFDEVYAAHVAFVWRIARMFGVPEASLEDVVQDVFVVVHRQLPAFEPRAAITTWLFAITRRVALGHRRRVRPTEALDDELVGRDDPFAAVSRSQAAATLASILDKLDEDQRLVFALVELEQLSVPEVARMLELNVNTAYSRLRLARAAVEAEVRRRRLT